MEAQTPAVNPLNNAGARPHPVIMLAAGAVTLFCLTGIAALAGWLPKSAGTSATPEPAIAPVAMSAPVRMAAPVRQVVATAPAAKPRTLSRPAERRAVAEEAPLTQAAEPAYRPLVLSQAPAAEPAPVAEPVRRICHDCGTIESVQEVERPGETNGVGIGAGAVLGGLLGRQMGGGRGRDAMTVLGAIGGAVAGNQIEKHTRRTLEYQVTVRFEDGSTQTLTQATPPGWRAGDRVRVVNGSIQANG